MIEPIPKPFSFEVRVPTFMGWRIVAAFIAESDARMFAHSLLAFYDAVKVVRADDMATCILNREA